MSREVQGMFRGIVNRYDLTNDILSCGTHRLWRRDAVRSAGIKPGQQVLDLCTGTGEIAFSVAQVVGESGSIVGVDFVYEMLEFASSKESLQSLLNGDNGARLSFIQADALNLPFPDCSFDVVTIAFGIRNVDDCLSCLKEMSRVLRDNGIVIILEFGKPSLFGFAALYRLYSSFVMPVIGGMLTGDRRAYEYLPRTSREFPDGNKFLELMKQAGFASLQMKSYLSGVAYAYKGRKRARGV